MFDIWKWILPVCLCSPLFAYCTSQPSRSPDSQIREQHETLRTSAGEELRIGEAIVSKHDLDALASLSPGFDDMGHRDHSSPEIVCGEKEFWFHGVCLQVAKFRYWYRRTESNPEPSPEPSPESNPERNKKESILRKIVDAGWDRCAGGGVKSRAKSDVDKASCKALAGYIKSQEVFLALKVPMVISPVILSYLRPIYHLESVEGWQFLTSEVLQKQDLVQRGWSDKGVIFYVTSGKGFGNGHIYRLAPVGTHSFSQASEPYVGPWHYSHTLVGKRFVLDARLGAVMMPSASPSL